MNALGVLLNLHQGWNFWKWCRQNGCINSNWGGLMYVGGAKRLEPIHAKIFPERGTRIRIQDLGDAFPETLITADAYEIDSKQLTKIYNEMEESLERLQGRIDKGENEDTPLVVMLRARQQAELLKVPTICELVEDAIAEGNSVAVFVNFNDTLRSLSDKLKKQRPEIVVGGQSDPERDRAVSNFQADRSRLIICNIAAGGVGISLHDLRGEYPRVSLISPAYSAINLVQALGRVHRAGGKSKSIQRIIFAAGCVEEEACKSVNKKIQNLNALNDGDLRSGIFTK
jgi:superfamily II DNA or RNA helicase